MLRQVYLVAVQKKNQESKGKKAPNKKEKVNATSELLSVVPVFALTDDSGRPVLMQTNDTNSEEQLPMQLWFIEVNVARAHAAHISEISGSSVQLKLAMSNLDSVRENAKLIKDRQVRICADPREVHVARQLLLRAAGFVSINSTEAENAGSVVIDFTNETIVTNEAKRLQSAIGVDFDTDVPLFTLAALNATIQGEQKTVQPWFLSFADLVRAYVNSTSPANADQDELQRHAQAALDVILQVGTTSVTTLDKLLSAVQNGNEHIFIMPPASSVQALTQARIKPGEAPQSKSGLSASSIFDDDDDSTSSALGGSPRSSSSSNANDLFGL